MIKFKNTKRALVMSALALVVCISMLIGSTFAWFTDTVSSGSNIIKSGKLEVSLLDADGATLEGQMIEWVTDDNRAQDEILWEPNCTYYTEDVYVKNTGNLNLKFKLAINGIDGDAKLLEVVDFTAVVKNYEVTVQHPWGTYTTTTDIDLINGTTVETGLGGETLTLDEFILEPGESMGPIVLSGHMDANAGNDYQSLTIEGIGISVIATQAVGEYDSNDGMYDENAEYPVVDAQELAGALVNGGSVVLGADVDASNETVYASVDGTTIDLGGNKLTAEYITSAGDATISNGTLTMPSEGYLYAQDGANVTLEDVVIDSDDLSIFAYTDGTVSLKNVDIKNTTTSNPIQNYGGTMILENVTAAQAGDATTAWYSSAIQVINVIAKNSQNKWEILSQANTLIESGSYKGKIALMISAPGGNVTINGGTFEGSDYAIKADFAPNNYVGGSNYESKIIINGGNFIGNIKVSAATELVIKGGTFTVDPTAYLATGYVATENSGVWTVTAQ